LLALLTSAAPAFAGTFGLFTSHGCCNSCCNSGCVCFRQYNAFTPFFSGTVCLNGCTTLPSPFPPPVPAGYGMCGPGGCGPHGCGPEGFVQGPMGFGDFTSMAPHDGYPTEHDAGLAGDVPATPPMKMPKVEPTPLPAPAPAITAPVNVQPTAYQPRPYAPPAANYRYAAPNSGYGMYGYPAPGYGYYVPGMMANPNYAAPTYWNGR
jgi:hypothetical protein